MPPAPSPATSSFIRLSILLGSCLLCYACTALVEDRLEDGPAVHCAERNLRLSRELDPGDCVTVIGERLTARLLEHTPETVAVVSFSLAETPQEPLRVQEHPVTAGAEVSFAIPELPVPAGSRLRVQIQGRHVLHAFSGHFEVILEHHLATIDADGLVTLRFVGAAHGAVPRTFGRIPTGLTDGPDLELVFSPDGRHLVAGAPALSERGRPLHATGPVARRLAVLDAFGRSVLARFEDTGGIDSVGFLPAGAAAPARLVWSRRDAQTGRFRMVAGELKEDGLGPAVAVTGLPEFVLPPRLVHTADTLAVLPRDHLASWLAGEPAPVGPELQILSSALALTGLGCADLLGAADPEAVPVDLVLAEPPGLGRIALASCATGLPSAAGGTFTVTARWLRWEETGPRLLEDWTPFAMETSRPPLGWVLPGAPNPHGPALLHTAPSDTPEYQGPILWDADAGAAVPCGTDALGGFPVRALLADADSLLLFVPPAWRPTPALPGEHLLLEGHRDGGRWSFQAHARDLQYALAWSEDLLLLANTEQMIQSTLDDFTAGLPGALFAPSACVFAVLKPSHR